MKLSRLQAALAAAALATGATTVSAQEADVTFVIRAFTPIEAEIAKLCNDICLGDERSSWMERAYIRDLSAAIPTLVLEIRLRNRQRILGIQVSDTAHVTAEFDLDILACRVAGSRISSNNDIYQAAIQLFDDELAAAFNGAEIDLGPLCQRR